MPLKDIEKRKEYNKEYREKNQKKILEYQKEYYVNNKEKFKEYNEKNKDKISEYMKEYRKTDKGLKSTRISHWREYGVIDNFNDNYEILYEYYLSVKECETCC